MKRLCALALAAWITSVPPAQSQLLDSVASTLAIRLEGGRKSVAVVDFTDLQGTATELGRYLAEELSVSLATRAKAFVVVDRTHLKSILQEHRLAASGVIDPATARQLGKLAGVDTLVTGTLTPFGDSVRLAVKALDTQTAAMVAATAVDIARTNAIEELLTRSVGPDAGGQSRQSPAKPGAFAGAAIQRGRGAGLAVELQSCSKSGTCRFFLTAENDTRVWGISSRAWDGAGNEFDVESTVVGNRQGGVELIAGVRTPLTITFSFSGSGNGISSRMASRGQRQDPEVLSAIELGYYTNISDAKLRFRNVPLQ